MATFGRQYRMADGSNWSGLTVQLRKGATIYTLTETPAGSGFYKNTALLPGYYELYDNTGGSLVSASEHFHIGQVESDGIKADAVNGAHIANDAVDTEHINDGAITQNKMAFNAIDTEHINDGAITQNKMAFNAINTEHVSNGAITQNKMALNSVGPDNIDNGAVKTEKINPGAVTEEKLADNAVSARALADGSVSINSFDSNLTAIRNTDRNDLNNVMADLGGHKNTTASAHPASAITTTDGTAVDTISRLDGRIDSKSDTGHSHEPSGLGDGGGGSLDQWMGQTTNKINILETAFAGITGDPAQQLNAGQILFTGEEATVQAAIEADRQSITDHITDPTAAHSATAIQCGVITGQTTVAGAIEYLEYNKAYKVELDDKSDIGHGHAIDDVALLSGALSGLNGGIGIQDGAIKARHINNGELPAAKITGGSITSAQVADNGITSDKLEAGIRADKIAGGNVNDTEFGHLDGVTSNIQGQISGLATET